MKLLLVLCITLSAVWAEPQAPYPVSGWRPEGRAFELPERTPRQYLPPVQPRVPLPRDLDDDLSVQGLPDDKQLPQFQGNSQYQPQRQNVQRQSTSSQTAPAYVTPRQFTTRPLFSSAKPTISSTSTSTTTQSDLNEGEETSENDNQQNNEEEDKKKIPQPEIILTPVAQIRLQTISTNPSFNSNHSPLLVQQESNPSQFNGLDGSVHFAALQRILAQQNLVQPQSYVQTRQVVIQSVPAKSSQIQSNPVLIVSQNLSPPQKLQSNVDYSVNPLLVQYQSQNSDQNRANDDRQLNQGQTFFVTQTQGYQPQDVQVTAQNVQFVPQNVGYQSQYGVSDVQNGQYVTQNGNYPQLNIQYQDQNMQYQPENVQYQPQNLQYQPQNVQVQTDNVQYQPQNVKVQTDYVQYQPQNAQVQSDGVQPQTVQYHQPNLQYQPQNIQYEPQNVQLQTENAQPQIIQYQQPNVQFTARTLPLQPQNFQAQIKPTQPQNVEYQPQIVQLQPLNVQLQPQNVQVQPQNVQIQNGQHDSQTVQNPNYDQKNTENVDYQNRNVYQGANKNYQPLQGQLVYTQSVPPYQQFYQGFAQNQQFGQNQQVAPNQQTNAQKQQFAQNQQYAQTQYYTQNQQVAQNQQYSQNQQYAQNQPFAQQQFYQYQQLNQAPLTNQEGTNQGADSLQSGLDVNKQGNDLGDEKTTDDVNADDDDESGKEATTKVYNGFGDRTRPNYGVPIPKQISTSPEVASDESVTTENYPARTDPAGYSGRHGRRKSAKLRNRRVRPVFTVDNSGHLVLSGEQA